MSLIYDADLRYNIFVNGKPALFDHTELSKSKILESFLGVSSCMFCLEDYRVSVAKFHEQTGKGELMRHLNVAKDFSFKIEPDFVYKITVKMEDV